MEQRLDGLPHRLLHLINAPPRIDPHPRRRVPVRGHLAPNAREHLSHLTLQFLLLVPLLTVPAPRARDLRRDVEEEREVGRRKARVRRAAPRVGQALGGGEGDAGKGVAVADDGRPRREQRADPGAEWGSVKREGSCAAGRELGVGWLTRAPTGSRRRGGGRRGRRGRTASAGTRRSSCRSAWCGLSHDPGSRFRSSAAA